MTKPKTQANCKAAYNARAYTKKMLEAVAEGRVQKPATPALSRSCFEDPEALKNPKPLSFDLDSLTDPTASEELTGLFCSRKRRGGCIRHDIVNAKVQLVSSLLADLSTQSKKVKTLVFSPSSSPFSSNKSKNFCAPQTYHPLAYTTLFDGSAYFIPRLATSGRCTATSVCSYAQARPLALTKALERSAGTACIKTGSSPTRKVMTKLLSCMRLERQDGLTTPYDLLPAEYLPKAPRHGLWASAVMKRVAQASSAMDCD